MRPLSLSYYNKISLLPMLSHTSDHIGVAQGEGKATRTIMQIFLEHQFYLKIWEWEELNNSTLINIILETHCYVTEWNENIYEFLRYMNIKVLAWWLPVSGSGSAIPAGGGSQCLFWHLAA